MKQSFFTAKSFGILALSCLATVVGCTPTSFLVTPVPAARELQETRIHCDPGLFVGNKIAVIDHDGLMINTPSPALFGAGENPVSVFLEKLDKARHDPAVKAVVLRLNTPGGTVAASDLMHHALTEFRRTSGKPIVTCVLDMAASGGYYLACASDGILAQPTAITGSIGTVLQTVSFAGTMKKLGIKAEAIKSGDLKDMASPLHDLHPDERRVLQEIINRFYENFLTVILDGRKNLDRTQLLPLADGRVFTAPQALDAGLIDRIGYPQDAVAWAKQLAGIEKTCTVVYHRPHSHKPNVYASAHESIAPQALINLELPHWLKAEGARFLYLWQPEYNLNTP